MQKVKKHTKVMLNYAEKYNRHVYQFGKYATEYSNSIQKEGTERKIKTMKNCRVKREEGSLFAT